VEMDLAADAMGAVGGGSPPRGDAHCCCWVTTACAVPGVQQCLQDNPMQRSSQSRVSMPQDGVTRLEATSCAVPAVNRGTQHANNLGTQTCN
jgi:hypothetical protein